MPNFSIYLYTCLFLFLTNVLLLLLAPLSLSLSPLHTGDFSRRLKFMLSRVPGACISRFVSRDVRFAPGYAHARVHVCAHTRVCAERTHVRSRHQTYTHIRARATGVSLFLSLSLAHTARFSRLALSLTSLFVSAARSGRGNSSSGNGSSSSNNSIAIAAAAIIVVAADARKIYDEKARATKGPPMTVSFQRTLKLRCGPACGESIWYL